MTTPAQRPRTVEAAFWCWLVASVLLMVLGLMSLSRNFEMLRELADDRISDDQVRSIVLLYRGAGVLAILIGLAIGYLAGRVRRGDKRFRRAALALSLVTTLVLVVAALGLAREFVLPLILVIAAAMLVTRPSAQKWFDSQPSETVADG